MWGEEWEEQHACHSVSLEVRGHLAGDSSLFPLRGFWGLNSACRLGGKGLYPLSYLASLFLLFVCLLFFSSTCVGGCGLQSAFYHATCLWRHWALYVGQCGKLTACRETESITENCCLPASIALLALEYHHGVLWLPVCSVLENRKPHFPNIGKDSLLLSAKIVSQALGSFSNLRFGFIKTSRLQDT